MRALAVLFGFVAGLTVVPASLLPALAAGHAAAPIRVAPADEYFGRLKMSILGIRNQLRDLGLRLQYAPDKGEAVLGSAAMVEDALRDWEHKYPADPWLAKSVYDLTALYAHVTTPHGHAQALHAMRWLMMRYGHSSYAMQARAQIGPIVGIR